MKKEKKKTDKAVQKETKQLIGVLVSITILFLAVLIPYFYIQSQKSFDYLGVNWQKEQYGDLTIYHTRFPKIYQGKDYGIHNVYLRNNPKQNNITSEIEKLTFKEKIVVTQSREILNCSNQIIVSTGLGQITQALPFIKNVTGATSNKEFADELNISYSTCENIPTKTTIIQLDLTNQTKISKLSENCYLIEIDSCEQNILASEKFILEIIKALNFQKIEWTTN